VSRRRKAAWFDDREHHVQEYCAMSRRTLCECGRNVRSLDAFFDTDCVVDVKIVFITIFTGFVGRNAF
jgi:hypothetical protein